MDKIILKKYIIKPTTEIKYYVIHLHFSKDREKYINKLKETIKNLEIFNAINNPYNNELIINNKLLNGEICCYLSHYNLIKQIKYNDSYTVIFEDDAHILSNFKIQNIINKIDCDFDIIFLGNLNENHGEIYKDNIYYVNKKEKLTGTHCYLLNNKNKNKILNLLINLDEAIDNKFKKLIDNNLLNAFVIYPVMVIQNKCKSYINRNIYLF